MWRGAVRAVLALAVGIALTGGPAIAAGAPFPDVPPWHWGYDSVQKAHEAGIILGYPSAPGALAENSLVQVYDAFAHASAPGAQQWAERFTYNRPADWPAPLARAQVAAFSLTRLHAVVSGETAVATFTATVTTRGGRTISTPMRVPLRRDGEDWQADYARLAQGSPLFR